MPSPPYGRVTFRYRLVILHLLAGLLIIPVGLGHLDITDFLVRLPAILVVALDAGTAFQIAVTYTKGIYPHRMVLPHEIQTGMLDPWMTWLAALGYYIICLWVVMAIIARPDDKVDWTIAVFFVSGFVFVGVYKLALVRVSAHIRTELESRSRAT